MKLASFLLGILLSTGAFAWEHATYNCTLSNPERLIANGQFVSNKTLILEAEGARFSITEMGQMDAGPEQAVSYQVELRVAHSSALTTISATEPHPFLQLTHDGKEYEASCLPAPL